LRAAFLEAHPIRTVPTWERSGRRTTPGDAVDDEAVRATEVERLRALGYIR
jgi:hypothetical protein